MSGPVTDAIEKAVLTFVRQHGLVVWLDREGQYTGYVDALIERHESGDVATPVAAYRGSYVDLLLALEDAACGVDNAALLVHMPGHHEDSIKSSPVYELRKAGKRFDPRLDTLVGQTASGLATPEEIQAFLAQDDLTLEAADAWLARQAARREGGLAPHLGPLSLTALLDDLLGPVRLAAFVREPADLDQLWDHLQRHTGVDASWRPAEREGGPGVNDLVAVGEALAGWALCVEYVHDLARAPFHEELQPLTALAAPLVEACQGVAVHLRAHAPRDYVGIADGVEERLHEEFAQGSPEDLGRVDTFRIEEARLLRAALDGLDEDRWDDVAGWADDRLARSFWVSQERDRRAAWQLVARAAGLGRAIEDAGGLLDDADTLELAVERYSATGWVVDRAHRELEQLRARLLETRLPHYGVLRQRLDHLRACYRTWADDLARTFAALSEGAGFLPTESLQQRHLFGQVVRPLAEDRGPVALFLVDALRYEMACALAREIEGEPSTRVDLQLRLAELPSVTAVGMNVLAPVVTAGRLEPVIRHDTFCGFQTQAFQVKDPESRQRMMQNVVGGRTAPLLSLADVLQRDTVSLKKAVSEARIVLVHSQELDAAGESGAGLSSFEITLQQLRSAWSLLRDAGIRTFVVTSDHGFLLLDDTTHDAKPFGRKTDPHHRFALYPSAVQQPEMVTVSLASLGYDGAEGFVVFPRSTAVFDRGRRTCTFVHGGCSLQERAIPVLVVRHERDRGGTSLDYAIEAASRPGVAGMHCVQLTVVPAVGRTSSMAFGGPQGLELALRVPGRDDVQVHLCDVREGELRGAAAEVRLDRPAEVFFKLRGPDGERVPVEVYYPGGGQAIGSVELTRLFEVQGGRSGGVADDDPDERPSWDGVEGWLERLPEGGPRTVFAHLARHGVVTEAEAIGMLGSPRKARRFANEFDGLLAQAPFGARIEITPTGKRYVREGGE